MEKKIELSCARRIGSHRDAAVHGFAGFAGHPAAHFSFWKGRCGRTLQSGFLRFAKRFSLLGRKKKLPDALSLSLPTGILGRTPYLSLRGQEELEIFGCVSILCYEDERILLQLTRGCLRITGRSLTMRTYQKASMTVGGLILGIDFPPEKEAQTAPFPGGREAQE